MPSSVRTLPHRFLCHKGEELWFGVRGGHSFAGWSGVIRQRHILCVPAVFGVRGEHLLLGVRCLQAKKSSVRPRLIDTDGLVV